jgi:uncharacterized membrane protein YoaK (UPF0700 family)
MTAAAAPVSREAGQPAGGPIPSPPSASAGSPPLTRLDPPARLFACALAAVAGYVDGAGFLLTGGYFVSFMSGNSTRLGVGFSRGAAEAVFAGGLIAAFLTGVVGGASLRRFVGRKPEAAILATLALALAVSGWLAFRGIDRAAALVLAAAMGAENTIFVEGGEVRVGLTYMTGALVKVGKGLAAELFGEAHLRWAPNLLLWISLVFGAAFGATAYARLGAGALWLAAAVVALLAPVALKVFPLEPPPED